MPEAATEVAPACRPALRAGSAAFARALSGRMRYVLGPEEIVLAGASGWVQGHREPEPDGAAAALNGQWLVLSANGVPPPPSEQPAELAFGPGSFAVWDGCRHSEGVALIRARQLFTLGSGIVTMANCPPDPIRARIRAVVAASPRIAHTREGSLALVSRSGTLRLDRRSTRRFGTGVAMTLRPGNGFDVAAGTRGTARLLLAPAERFSLALPCGRLTGRWRNHRDRSGGYARFSPDPPPASCAADPAARRLERFFTGDVLAAIGPNKDIALFVSRGKSLAGRVAS